MDDEDLAQPKTMPLLARPRASCDKKRSFMTSSAILTAAPDPADQSVPLDNIRVRKVTHLITPLQIKAGLPVSERQRATVQEGRRQAQAILAGEDDRLLVVVGPCSIHDATAAREYARRLSELAERVADRYFLVMRVYFEKPRTTIGWKGLINDPKMDDSCDLACGISLARELLLDLADLGLPAATEFLDPIIPQYLADLISWTAIGARTTESQTHREMSSGLSMPVGFKNGTDGGVQVAIDAMRSARSPHSFLGMDQYGVTSIIKTKGNPDSHVVLRGGRSGPNYSAEHVAAVRRMLTDARLNPAIMVDCSHANSGKDHTRQPLVWESILEQRAGNRAGIIGAMLESNLRAGSQPLGKNPQALEYGVSITDACIDWETTEALLS